MLKQDSISNSVISHYKIIKKIGEGGMAAVYEAVDLNSNARVALKILHSHLSSNIVPRKRFLREGRIGLDLVHPQIVRVYDVGENENYLYIAMELALGKTLNTLLKQEDFDINRCLDITIKVAEALMVAHSKKIVHRDITPKNIIIYGENVKVMDFGLAKLVDASTLTGEYATVGTLSYMSPEQAIGSIVDERSDIFSLGVVLYQMITNRLPFQGNHIGSVIHAILFADPLRMTEIKADLPTGVDEVVLKALKKKPQDRYQSAADFCADLSKLLDMLEGQEISLIATEEIFVEAPRGIYAQLIGRNKEMKLLENRLKQALQGERQIVLISGETGVGKSRLAWELGQRAKQSDARYFSGGCLYEDHSASNQPLLEIIRDYFNIKGITDSQLLDVFIKDNAEHLSMRAEVINNILFRTPKKDNMSVNQEQLRDTVTELVKVITKDRPVLIHLDDLQWADKSTLQVLGYLAKHTREEQLFIIGTFRPEDLLGQSNGTIQPIQELLTLIQKEQGIEHMSLARLDKESTEAIVHSVFKGTRLPETFIDLLYRETEGNPLFIVEVLKSLKDEKVIIRDNDDWKLTGDIMRFKFPGQVKDVIIRRLRRLKKNEREILSVAAVDGYVFQSDAISHCLNLPRLTVLRTLQDLESSHFLIHALAQGYQFDHIKIQEVVYDDLIPELKEEYHKLYAKYYREQFPDKDEYAGRIARHLYEAHMEDEALPYMLRAGNHADSVWSSSLALDYYTKAIEIIDNLQYEKPSLNREHTKLNVLMHKMEHQLLLGYNRDLIKDTNTAWKLSKEIGTKKDQIRVLSWFGHFWRRIGQYKQAIQYHKKASTLCQEIDDQVELAYNLTTIGANYWIMGHYAEALPYVQRALRIHRKLGDKYNIARDLYYLAMTYYTGGQFKKALKNLRLGLKLFEVKRTKNYIAYTTVNMGQCYISLRDHKNGENLMKKAIQLLQDLGEKHMRNYALMSIGIVHRLRGEYTHALKQFEHILAESEERGEQRLEVDLLINIGTVHNILGDFKPARELFQRSLKICKKIGLQRNESFCYLHLGHTHFLRGDYKKACAKLERSLSISRKYGLLDYQWLAERDLYSLWLNLGDRKRARKAIEHSLQLTRVFQTKETDVTALYDKARLQMLKDSQKSVAYLVRKGLRLARRRDLVDSTIEGLRFGAELEMEKKNLKKARKHAMELLHLSTDKARKPDKAYAHLLLALILFRGKEYNQAGSHARTASAIAEECGMKEILWQSLHQLGRIYKQQKEYDCAYSMFAKAHRIMERIAAKLDNVWTTKYMRKKETKSLIKDMKISRQKRNGT